MKKLNQNNIDTKKMTFGQRLERYIEKNEKPSAAIDALHGQEDFTEDTKMHKKKSPRRNRKDCSFAGFLE